ncbi:CopG family transcriptional regulator [Sphaerisporangium sp. TRM90804]|uniref:CopG family transcriptional regulator n=1 Tax=Sphaerisporangium sp. TRM90804 TaxID=3031113 RepID=UPI002448187A|nr:CopG family transcriptional regulator [Sphaerisporangium sp. TRM90804]MDH2424165.1 CopG family transcriptional regulator [Sphaerisporangium sp. TRM90804]
MTMTLRLSEEHLKALRLRADKEGRSVQQVVHAAVEEYIARHDADEEVRRLGSTAACRWRPVLDRLGD